MKKLAGILIIVFCFFSINTIKNLLNYNELIIDDSHYSINLKKLKKGNYKKIIIKGINLKKIPSELFANRKLEYLDLSNNNIEAVSDRLNELNKLQILKLNNNKIKDFDKITNLNRLSYLDLSNNKLTKIRVLSKYNNLEYLNLSYNKINSIAKLNKHKKLKTLYLNNNQLISLSDLPKGIKNINLKNNYLNNNCCNMYKSELEKQNKIMIKDTISKKQLYFIMGNKDYLNRLLITSDNSDVTNFKVYELNFFVENNIYSTKDFLEKYDDRKGIEFSIIIDVINYNNDVYRVYGSQVYQYNCQYKNFSDHMAEAVGFVDEDMRNVNSLSYLIFVIFLVPLIIIVLIFIYLNKLFKNVEHELNK